VTSSFQRVVQAARSTEHRADQAQVLNRYTFEINLSISIKDLIRRPFGLLGVSRLIVSWPAKVSLIRVKRFRVERD